MLGIPIGIRISSIGLKICAIEKYRSINKNKTKHDKIALLAKSTLNSMEVLISEALNDSNIDDNKFVLINSLLKEYDDMKEKWKNLKT